MERLTVGSLFSGIGGFDLGLERTGGFRTAWFCEQDEFCRRVLAKHWPGVPCHTDITLLWAPKRVDVLCGGFPCQDLSYAGRGAGIGGERSGLWSEYARLIRELRPRYVIVENVSALLARGLDVVLGDLAACGYDAEWDCIPASAVGAPHRRDRVWLVAYSTGRGGSAQRTPGAAEARTDLGARGAGPARGERGVGDANGAPTHLHAASGPPRQAASERGLGAGELADTEREGLQGLSGSGIAGTRRAPGVPAGVREGLGGQWVAEPDVGRVAHGVPHRVDRLRSLGNALVPQIAEWLGHRILEHEQEGRLAA